MIEIPEAVVIAGQIDAALKGRRIDRAVANASPHRFAWYSGDPAEYNARLASKTLEGASALGGNIEMRYGDMLVSVSAPIRYHAPGAKVPAKHQLLIAFDDGSAITSSAQMWGGFFCFPVGSPAGFPDRDRALGCPSPLSEAFDRAYFQGLFGADTADLSTKAFLATEQRIPGLGNGVLQDILWTAHLHPKRKMGTLGDDEVQAMYEAVKGVLAEMTARGGRDTESDLYGRPGGYVTVLSRNTVGQPCKACGEAIRKVPYLGGSIYYCPGCQPL